MRILTISSSTKFPTRDPLQPPQRRRRGWPWRAECHTSTKQAQGTQGAYSDFVSWDGRAYKTYWLRLQAKHDKSVWYNLTKEFTQNEKLTHLISQGGIDYKSKDPCRVKSLPITVPHASELRLTRTAHVRIDLLPYFLKGEFFNFKIILKGEYLLCTILN